MEYIAIAFRSRAHTMKFYQLLTANGVYAQIVNTPKEAGVGCGLSAKISPSSLVYAKKVLSKSGLNSFAGIFSVKELGSVRSVRSIS